MKFLRSIVELKEAKCQIKLKTSGGIWMHNWGEEYLEVKEDPLVQEVRIL